MKEALTHPVCRLILIVLAVVVGPVVVGVADAPASQQQRPVKVLLLSGQNNHNWQKTTPKLKSLLESTGRFEVDVTERPDQLTAETLKPYQVILSNWNAWKKGPAKVADWPEATRSAYLDFVHSGGGHVVVHAGSSSFFDWSEYQRLTLASWKLGQTGHGPKHEFAVRIDPVDHPITHGLADFRIHGELWNRAGIQEGVTVLASAFSAEEARGSGQYEPMAMVSPFGQGRSFTLLLGHDAEEMENPGFVALLVRGTEWAATGRVTIHAPGSGKTKE